MERIPYLGHTIFKWQVGASSFLALPEKGARLMNWNVTLGDGSVRDIIYWPEIQNLDNIAGVRGGKGLLPFRRLRKAMSDPANWEARPLDLGFLIDSLPALEAALPHATDTSAVPVPPETGSTRASQRPFSRTVRGPGQVHRSSGPPIRALALSQGYIWIGSERGLRRVRLPGGPAQWVGQESGFVGGGVSALGTDASGRVLIGTDVEVGRFSEVEGAPRYQTVAKLAQVGRLGSMNGPAAGDGLWASTPTGLFFIGEVLDVTGWLGGYNFQWAWAAAAACAGALATDKKPS